ncbi:MAG: hypothetical protein WD187_01060 [Candidatus Woykebacteria bacterium]
MAKEIVIDIKPTENKLKAYLPLIIAAVSVAGLFFLVGFAIGNYTSFELPLFQEKEATKSATRKGWFVYESSKFTIEYPKGWKVGQNPKDGPAGAEILGPGARVEFWQDTPRAYKFTSEQKKKQRKTNSSKLGIDGREAQVTEYPYKDGDSFIVITLPEEKNKLKVIFWVNVANNEHKKLALEIVSTYKAITVSGKISADL